MASLATGQSLKSMYEEIRTIYPHAGITLVLSDRIRAKREAYIVPRGLHGFPKLCTAASQSDMVYVAGRSVSGRRQSRQDALLGAARSVDAIALPAGDRLFIVHLGR